jgi:peroxiredoxin
MQFQVRACTAWRFSRALTLISSLLAFIAIGWAGAQVSAAQSAPGTASPAAINGSAYAVIPAGSRMAAPDLTLIDINGKRLALSDYRGKVVLLDFWAVDCGGCKTEIPWYVDFDREYRSRGLALLGIDMYGETAEYIRPFMIKSHMNYRVAVGNDAIRERFHAGELPMTLLIDRKGRIAVSHIGIVDKAKFEQDIQQLLR